MADFTGLNKKVLGGDLLVDGVVQGVLIEQVVTKTDEREAGDPDMSIEFMGFAKTKLKDNYNPSAGFDDLPEPIPVSDRWKITVSKGGKVDNAIVAERLNRELQLDPPLTGGEDEWERFLQGSENSIYDKLVGSRFYFNAKLNEKKKVNPPAVLGESASDYFYNLVSQAKREEASVDKGGATIKAQLAKLKAKKQAAASFTAE